MGVIAAYDMYVECCEGVLDGTLKVDKKNRMTFSQFRLRLKEQMLRYDPRDDCMQVTINSEGVHSCINSEGERVRIYLEKIFHRRV